MASAYSRLGQGAHSRLISKRDVELALRTFRNRGGAGGTVGNFMADVDDWLKAAGLVTYREGLRR